MFWTYFLKLAFAHVFVRFLVQPYVQWAKKHWILRCGISSALKSLVVAVLLVPELDYPMFSTLLVYGFASATIDGLEEKSARPKWVSFSASQLLYLLVFYAIATWWTTSGDIWLIEERVLRVASDHRVLWYSCVYIGAIFGGNELTKRVADHFSKQFTDDIAPLKPGLRDAGQYIGWLERFLIVTFVVSDFGDAVGFLLAAKALARYPEIKGDQQGLFAEYFLIGTLTSVGIALLAGLVLRWALG